jgi:tetratricopeptide (TPR) repeat protein
MTSDSKQDSVEVETSLVSLDTGIGGMSFGAAELLSPDRETKKREALRLFQEAHNIQMQGNFHDAVELYQQSINAYPTAEGHTFLGWTYSLMGRTDEAIEECHRAIEVDPAFGNPYNDIGAYLIEKGELDAAIPWLRKAMSASRYECYFYPHFNLGRIYEAKQQIRDAMNEYYAALQINKDYILALQAFRRLQAQMN